MALGNTVVSQSNDLEIVNAPLQNPPRQYSITVPAGGSVPFYYNFNFMRVLSLATADAPNLKMRFGDTGSETDVIGTGLGYELPFIIDRVTFRNTGGTPIDLTFIIAIGRIYDDRLSLVGGTIPTQVLSEIPPGVGATGRVVVSNTAAVIIAANTTRKLATIYAGASDIYIGFSAGVTTANGLFIPAGGYYETQCSSAIYGIRSAVSTVAANFADVSY